MVSDTHGLLDPRVLSLFKGVGQILHAGDVVGGFILEELEQLAPLVAVAGNNDHPPFGRPMPQTWVDELAGQKVLMLHDLGRLDRPHPEVKRLIQAHQPRVVVSGHTHQPHTRILGRTLYLNPGSAGPRRFRLPRCAALLELGPQSLRAEVRDLESGATLCSASLPA